MGHQISMHPLQHLPLLPGVVHNQVKPYFKCFQFCYCLQAWDLEMYLKFLQANVAPNIPQQDSQEVSFRFTISCLILFSFQGQQGPAAFVGGHQILPLQHLPLLPGVGLNQVSMPLTYYVFRLYIRSKMCPFYSILLFYSIRLTRF